MKNKLILSILISGMAQSALLAEPFAQTLPVLQGQVSFVPAGTPVPVIINEALGSEFSSVGQTFNATLTAPLYAGSQLVAGPGSTVQGQIVAVESAARASKPGSIDIRLSSVITPDGRRYPLSAKVDTNTFSLSADGGTLSGVVKGTAVGAGAGALSGLVGAAISGGSKGKAAAIGTGIGGGIGLLGGALRKGQDFVLKAGSQVPFILDQPLQINAAPNSQVQQYLPQGGYQPSGGFADPSRNTNPYL